MTRGDAETRASTRPAERGVLIHWVRDHRRSTELARRLGVEFRAVFPSAPPGPLGLFRRYLVSCVETWRILSDGGYDYAVLVVPPNVGVLVCEWFRRFAGPSLRVLYDAHTGAILDGKWSWTLPLLRWALARNGSALSVTNTGLVDRVGGDGNATFCLPDPLPAAPDASRAAESVGGPTVFVVNSFAADEPLEELLAAATRLPDVRFRITGNPGRAGKRLPTSMPDNVDLTGFLPEDEYWEGLRAADLALVATTRPLTLVCGGYEALAVGTPLVLSDHPTLRDYFCRGAVFADNSATGFLNAIEDGLHRRAELAAEIPGFRKELEAEWGRSFARVRTFLTSDARQDQVSSG